MQVYADLDVLTARPDHDDLQACQHELFGHIDGAERCSVARYLRDFAETLDRIRSDGRSLLVVGGTGMYIDALLSGLSPTPDVSADLSSSLRDRLEAEGAPALWHELERFDPEYASRLAKMDGQRILRALEVITSTGHSLLYWQNQPRSVPLLTKAFKLALLPDRDASRRKIRLRLDEMIAQGAVEEVERLLKRGLDPTLPVMKAHGVPEFAKYLEGDWSKDEARDRTAIHTGQYAKRQSTWLRHRAKDFHVLDGFGRSPDVIRAAKKIIGR